MTVNSFRPRWSRRFGFGAIVLSGLFSVPAFVHAITPPPPAAETPAAPAGAGETTAEFDLAAIARGLEAWKEGGCRACHGWAGNGDREGPTPPGPSLRETQLDIVGIRYTVQCGRLGAAMPYFDREAYRDDRCGMTAAQAGNLLPPRSNNLLSEEEIGDLAIYIVGYLQGRGEITFEECEDYFGEGATRCQFYLNP